MLHFGNYLFVTPAYTQTLMVDQQWEYWPPAVGDLMRRFRTAEGERLVLRENLFVEKVLPGMTLRKLPDDVWNEYRRPYHNKGEDRRPTLTWPREIPVEGQPADVLATIESHVSWLSMSPVRKLYTNTKPGVVRLSRLAQSGYVNHAGERLLLKNGTSGKSAQNDESLGAWIYFEANEPIGRSYAQNTELIRSIAIKCAS